MLLLGGAARGELQLVADMLRHIANPNVLSTDMNIGGCSTPRSPLMHASRNGHADVVQRLLLDRRVDPNMLDERGKSALMLACQYKHREVVQILMHCNRINPTAGCPARVSSVDCASPSSTRTLPARGTRGRVPSAPRLEGQPEPRRRRHSVSGPQPRRSQGRRRTRSSAPPMPSVAPPPRPFAIAPPPIPEAARVVSAPVVVAPADVAHARDVTQLQVERQRAELAENENMVKEMRIAELQASNRPAERRISQLQELNRKHEAKNKEAEKRITALEKGFQLEGVHVPRVMPDTVHGLRLLQDRLLKLSLAIGGKIEEIQTCPICMEKPKDTMLSPCGHRLCRHCVPKVTKCPECRAEITSRVFVRE